MTTSVIGQITDDLDEEIHMLRQQRDHARELASEYYWQVGQDRGLSTDPPFPVEGASPGDGWTP